MTRPPHVGFFEESANVQSSTRLFTQELIALAAVLAGGAVAYAFWGAEAHKVAVVATLLGGGLSSLVSAVVAIINRA